MTNINETAIQAIMESETFRISARSLAHQLHIPVKDASNTLLEEIYLHRHSLDDVQQRLSGRQRAEVNFAKKDLIRKQHKADNAYMKLFVTDQDNDGNSITENVESTPARKSAYSEDEIQRALTVIPMAFTDTTAGFINDVLTKGSEATKASHNMSTSQFNKKVKQTIKTAQEGNARKRLDKLLKSDTQLKLEENQQLAKTFIQMIEQEDTPKEWINNFLKEALDNKYFDEAFDATKYPGYMVKHWDEDSKARQDGYVFINKVNELTGVSE
ncbi:hypothetical protein EFL35_03710 [Weissella paramesenteroides]|uniref:hypothetical protein n=1 Tax=Weissella paramesenteroides TaxID=1249 RepID=UPI00223C27BF|nr:hypothetical protein [Weissella paramesenteroides]MCS9984099.1 hypothetical protein [Weissella paramesenteroides]MCS9997875.1 hypothetical protein [Weissella paramesenteroides]MCT0260192.1 hypothetical protein [Weissella paramesenteroides]